MYPCDLVELWEVVTVELDWRSAIQHSFRRSGWVRDALDDVQWNPAILGDLSANVRVVTRRGMVGVLLVSLSHGQTVCFCCARPNNHNQILYFSEGCHLMKKGNVGSSTPSM